METEKNIISAELESQSVQKTTTKKQKKRHLVCLLLLAEIIVLNAVYGLSTAEKGTPVWETLFTDNVIYKLWKKYPLNSKQPKKGVINGILFSEDNPVALINNELFHEGDVVDGVLVVQITPRRIQFKKDGKIWEQAVLEKPNSAW